MASLKPALPLALATCLCWAQLAQVTLPDTPAGRRFGQYLEIFNRGERSELKQFLEKYWPKEAERLDRVLGFREQTGGFDLKKIEESTATKIGGVIKDRDSNNYGRFEFEVEPAEPHLVTGFSARIIPRPAEFPALPRMSEAAALGALNSELEKRAGQDRFSGAALVARNGKAVFAQPQGLADREKKIPNKLDTKFCLGSMNKMFTAVAVAQLAQRGKIKLIDPLDKYLTDYPNKELASKVTIHHLLTHTGGTGDIFGPQFKENRLKLRELKDYVDLYGSRALQFDPGSRWAYSNYGFLLLGVLVERVSGQSYYDYVRQHIFKPAGMTSTDSLPEESSVPGRSVGYTRMGGATLRPNTDTLPVRGTSAGGGYSTVEDLLRFANALLGNKLLNAEYTKLATTGKVDTPGGRSKYAYGFGETNEDGIRWFGHGGGAPGINGELRIFPDSGYVIAVLANLDPPAASRLADFIAERLPLK